MEREKERERASGARKYFYTQKSTHTHTNTNTLSHIWIEKDFNVTTISPSIITRFRIIVSKNEPMGYELYEPKWH